MARLGAHAVGIDAGDANIKAAMVHADQVHVDVDYRVGTVEGLIAAGEPKFDIVLSLEVVEHVADPARFLADCASLLAPGGLMVMATLNRTAKAFALAVVGAEHVLRWLPPGTHDWSKFVTPEEARAAMTGAGLAVHGGRRRLILAAFGPLEFNQGCLRQLHACRRRVQNPDDGKEMAENGRIFIDDLEGAPAAPQAPLPGPASPDANEREDWMRRRNLAPTPLEFAGR